MNREKAIDHLLWLTQEFIRATSSWDDEHNQRVWTSTYDALRALDVTEGELPPDARRDSSPTAADYVRATCKELGVPIPAEWKDRA